MSLARGFATPVSAPGCRLGAPWSTVTATPGRSRLPAAPGTTSTAEAPDCKAMGGRPVGVRAEVGRVALPRGGRGGPVDLRSGRAADLVLTSSGHRPPRRGMRRPGRPSDDVGLRSKAQREQRHLPSPEAIGFCRFRDRGGTACGDGDGFVGFMLEVRPGAWSPEGTGSSLRSPRRSCQSPSGAACGWVPSRRPRPRGHRQRPSRRCPTWSLESSCRTAGR